MHRPRVNSPLPGLLECENAGVVPLCLCTHTPLCDGCCCCLLSVLLAGMPRLRHCGSRKRNMAFHALPTPMNLRTFCAHNFIAATKKDSFQLVQSTG